MRREVVFPPPHWPWFDKAAGKHIPDPPANANHKHVVTTSKEPDVPWWPTAVLALAAFVCGVMILVVR